ncbi:MAG: hypothetical protein HQL88_08240, partial [Magnetococcales bacterium]|nr:hypothetical protein [Magnetococcales bacterium]
MTESSTIRRDNPLFIRYGSLVERCFAPGVAPGTPLQLLPRPGQGGREEWGGKKPLELYADPEEVAAAQKAVDKLRAALLEEAQGTESSRRGARSVTRQLHEFRTGLQRGKEAMLEENPFYGLAGLFYRISRTALQNAFVATQQTLSDNLPRPITVSRSYRHIWSSDRSVTSLRQKWLESLGKVGSLGKLLVGLLLFVGSTLTTAKGVADLVQLPEFIAWFGAGLSGSAHESARIAFSLGVGFALSSVILDYKSRLFLGTAEAGQILRGVYQAWRHHPRWVVIAAFLTMISIWTNYDGIVLLVTKTEDLAHQWRHIEQQVGNALGEAGQPNSDNPASLRDLHAALHKKVAAALLQLQKIPEDEMAGAASSGVASAGPRYWAKKFIIEGGYIPGKNDVAKVYKSTPLVGQIDLMLKRAPLDLQRSMADKMQQILARYDEAFRHSEAAAQSEMAALSRRMTLGEYSLEELVTLFKLEPYHVNAGVQIVVGHLEENKRAFAEAAQAINQLAEGHIALLREVDKIGTPANNTYTIDVQIGIPRLDALERLKQGSIPMAERRTLAELKEIMLGRYGVFLGGIFLFFILFLAVFMDLSDPILYTAMVARWGRRDRHFLDENIQRFTAWEEGYVRALHRFLVRSDVLALLPRLPTPKDHLFHDRYNVFLEQVEPRVKDPEHRDWWEKSRFWFLGLFKGSRIEYVEGYNARQVAVSRCGRDPKTYAPQLLNAIFPGLLEPVRIGVDHFDDLFTKIHTRMKQNEQAFEEAKRRYGPFPPPAPPQPEADSALRGLWVKSGLAQVVRMLRSGCYWLFWKPVVPPNPTFPLTRINQIRALLLSQQQSRNHIEQLQAFIPSLRHFLRARLFVIQETLLQPMAATLARIPNGTLLAVSLRIPELQTEYAQMERGLVELLGLSQFQGIQISEQMVQTIVEQSGIEELAGIYLRRDMPELQLERRIEKWVFRLTRAYALTKDLVEGQDTLIFTLTRIRREYLSPIHAALAPLQNRSRIEAALGLSEIKEDLEIIERCLLELWDTGSEPPLSGTEGSTTGLGAIIDLIRRNSTKNQAFSLIVYVQTLESRMAAIYKRLDTAIYQLSMVDRITTNALNLLDHALLLVQDIASKDEEFRAFSLPVRKNEQKKFDFLEENRLFFRTVSLQVEALRARIHTLDMKDCLLGTAGMELARELEKQAIMLRYFLKNALDFLEDKRDSVGLTAALVEVQPRSPLLAWPPEPPSSEPAVPASPSAESSPDGSEPPATGAPATEVPATEVPAAEVPSPPAPTTAPLPPSPAATPAPQESPETVLAEKILARCAQAKRVVLDMSLWEWDLLKKPIPPMELLQMIREQQPAVDQALLAVEGILVTLEGLSQWHAGHMEEIPAHATLPTLLEQADHILEQLHGIFDRISLPPSVDRRSKVAVTRFLKQKAAQRRAGEGEQAAPFLGETGDRRQVERVAVRCAMQVQSLDGTMTLVGVTRDVSAKGCCLAVEALPAGLVDGTIVHGMVLSDDQRTLFPGKIYRTSGPLLVLLLEAGYESPFMDRIRAEILQKRPAGAGILSSRSLAGEAPTTTQLPVPEDSVQTASIIVSPATGASPPTPTRDSVPGPC